VHYDHGAGRGPDRSRALLTTAPPGAAVQPLETMLLAAPVELPCPTGTTGALCDRTAAMQDLAVRYGASYLPQALLFLCGKTLADFGDAAAPTSCDRRVTRPLTIYGVAGHMHLRGVDISIELNPGSASARTLLHIPRWDFHWQDVYYLRKPVPVAPGDTVRVSCRFDDAGSKRYVLWGEGTTDEMCLGLLSVAVG
jgi:hypothetical protein